MLIKHIAFDLDGTLVDTRDQIVESLLACLAPDQRNAIVRDKLYRECHLPPKQLLKPFGITTLQSYWHNHSKCTKYARPFFDNTAQLCA